MWHSQGLNPPPLPPGWAVEARAPDKSPGGLAPDRAGWTAADRWDSTDRLFHGRMTVTPCGGKSCSPGSPLKPEEQTWNQNYVSACLPKACKVFNAPRHVTHVPWHRAVKLSVEAEP